MRAADTFALLKDAYNGWTEDKASRLAAALAFYTIFAIAPLLIVIIEIAGTLLGGPGHHAAVRDQILGELRPAIGDAGTKVLSDIVQATFDQRGKGMIASVVAWVLFAVAATGLIVAVQDALDTIWGWNGKQSFFQTLLDRLKSIAVIGGAAILVVAMNFATAMVNLFTTGAAAKIANVLLVLAVATLLIAAIYKWLPKMQLAWRDVWIGAIASAALACLGQYLIGLYLGRAATTSAFGAAGSLVAVLLWLYYSMQIFLFGAELSKAYANRSGSLAQTKTVPATTGTVSTTRSPSRASSP